MAAPMKTAERLASAALATLIAYVLAVIAHHVVGFTPGLLDYAFAFGAGCFVGSEP